MATNFDELLKKILKLSSDEQIRIVNAIHTGSHSKKADEKLQSKFIEERFADGFSCPHCGTLGRIVKYGKHRNGDQRYLCHECGQTFSPRNNTIYSRSKKDLATWAKFHECMANQMTVRQTAEICKINKRTAFIWRHKTLDAAVSHENTKVMKGVVEADETFFRTSYKGSRHLPREAKKRGTPMKAHSPIKERVCVPCAVDRHGSIFSRVATLGNITSSMLHKLYDDRLASGVTLCTDGFKPYEQYVMDNFQDLTHVVVSPKHHKNGVHHINHVNALHSSMKLFVANFKGVSTKYLENYLIWHNMSYGVGNMATKADKLISSSMKTRIDILWSDVTNRPVVPLAA